MSLASVIVWGGPLPSRRISKRILIANGALLSNPAHAVALSAVVVLTRRLMPPSGHSFLAWKSSAILCRMMVALVKAGNPLVPVFGVSFRLMQDPLRPERYEPLTGPCS